jgi:DNA-binding XRE family transcriptional regulator
MNLRQARDAKGISQEALAARLGITRRTVIRCEKANTLPRNKLVRKAWAKVIGIRPD